MTIDVIVTDSRQVYKIYANANQCPICHHKVTPRPVFAKPRSLVDRGAALEVVYECPNLECNELFIGYFSQSGVQRPLRLYRARHLTSVPVTLSKAIQDISPTFCE